MILVTQRLVLKDIDGGHAGAPRAQGMDQCPGLDQRRAAGIDQERGWLHAREIC